MKDFTVRRFAFAELDKEGQEKAIEQEVQHAHKNIDSDLITEILIDHIAWHVTEQKKQTLYDLDVLWSLSYSQGDGVSFKGSLTKEEATGIEFPAGVSRVKFTNEGRYTHWNSFYIEYYDEDGSEIYGDVEGSEAFMSYWQDMSRELEKKGYDAMEDLTSESRARESLMEDEDNFIYLESGVISPIHGEVVHA
jgi:hypothetical protein